MRSARLSSANPEPAPRVRRRRTANQRAVLELLGNSENFRSVQQLHRELRQQRPRTGLTTVYRILRKLVEDKVAESQRSEEGDLLYRLSSTTEHRHYLLCRLCGRAEAFTPTALEDHIDQLIREFGYIDVTHHLDVHGVCPGCQE